MADPQSSVSSFTAKEPAIFSGPDVESQQGRNNPSHWFLVLHPHGVTDVVLNHSYPGQGTPESPYVVDFLPQDGSNPMQYSRTKKWTITLLQALATLAVAFVSTAYSGGISEIIKYFQVSTIVAILGISLFVLGFAVGPLLWAPLSEFHGRQIVFFFTYFGLAAFSAGAAGAQNIHTLIILRFFAGSFGASPLTNAGGVIADMFNAQERGLATSVFAMAPFLGPTIGPIAGGFLGEAAGWRWVEGLMATFTGLLWIACSLYVPETYAPALLRRRAAKLSELTGKVYISKMDLSITATKAQQIKTTLLRPWVLLCTEPIVFLTAIYMAIVYGTLYLLFAAFPIVFQVQRGWSPGIGGLAFIGVAVGMLFAVAYSMYDNKRYRRVAAAHGGRAPPEARLPPAIIGSVLLPVGLFWFAWTNGPEIHWVVPIIASGFFAAGLVSVFLSLLSYMIDSYTVFAASVLAANSVLRSLFGAAFPLFTTYMYNDLGIHWASTVPAFLALACMPFPWLFWRYGARIRGSCKYAAEAAAVLAKMMEGAGQQQEKQEAAPAERPAGLPVTENRAVLSEDETVVGDGEEVRGER
ncbi:putative transporter mfs2 [Parachaetomium inaequale]|uniref:Transporter mfs2 n=1 Tax=Parachaetomium inaequale TaxID=2588326 RepID=A0AAN6PPR7_9PEZI|nr:putative transporter mfs2 [Parachaetomium inaequale]